MGELDLTPIGVCLSCSLVADSPSVIPFSDPFWILSAEELARLEAQMWRLREEVERLERGLEKVAGSKLEEPLIDRISVLDREAHLLHMVHAASRQYGPRPE